MNDSLHEITNPLVDAHVWLHRVLRKTQNERAAYKLLFRLALSLLHDQARYLRQAKLTPDELVTDPELVAVLVTEMEGPPA